MNYKWVPIAGDFEQDDHVITFKGKAMPAPTGEQAINFVLSNRRKFRDHDSRRLFHSVQSQRQAVHALPF